MLTVQSAPRAPSASSRPRQEPEARPAKLWRARTYFAIGLLLGLIVLVVIPAVWVSRGGGATHDLAWAVRLVVFVGSLLTMLMTMIAVGVAVTGQRVGVLWTARNSYSLSRLQVTMWTLLILSALAAVVACRAQGLFVGPLDGLAGALNVDIPSELLTVMGISVFSAAAAPAILSIKTQSDTPSVQQIKAAEARVGGKVESLGSLAVRPADCPPLVRDLFQSDQVSAAGTVDIGKLQQAIVTVVLWSIYLAMLADLFVKGTTSTGGITELPPMSEKFVYLLGISHAGYLAYKAAPTASAAAPATTTAPPASPSQSIPRPPPPSIR